MIKEKIEFSQRTIDVYKERIECLQDLLGKIGENKEK